MKFQFAKAVGLNTDRHATQIIVTPDGENDIFIGLLDLTSEDAFTKGRQILSDLSDAYIEKPEVEIRAGEKLKEIFDKALENLKAQEFSIILAVVTGKALYIIGQGEILCFLRRLDKISTLECPSGQIVSGFLQEGDRIFFATKNLTDYLGEGLDTSLELPREKWEEEIGASITADVSSMEDGVVDKDSSGRAGLIIDVEGDKPEVFTPVTEDIVSEETRKIKIPSIPPLPPLRGKITLAVAALLIVLVILGAGIKYKNTKDKEREDLFNNFLQQVQNDTKEAENLKTLNPEESLVKFRSALENVEKALEIKPKDQKALDLKNQIEENIGGKRVDDTNFSEFLDLELIKKGFKANYLSLSVGKLLSFNPDDGTLIIVDLAKKSQEILAGKDKLGEGKFASINGTSVFVYSSDKGVLRIDVGNEESSQSAKSDKEWKEIADITGFAGNFYLLDKGANQIWKYLVTSTGYSDKRKYLVDGVKADFTNALRMQIESSVYILKGSGEILRFTRGESDHFSIGGLDKGLNSPKSFYTSSEVENLYILDSGNSRLIVVSKTGAFKASYGGDKFASATDLVVDEEEKKLYLLERSKIWEMELK